jgi:hypothetical protein
VPEISVGSLTLLSIFCPVHHSHKLYGANIPLHNNPENDYFCSDIRSSSHQKDIAHKDVHFFFYFYLVGWDLTPLGPFAGPLGSYKSQYCGHTLAYCTFSPNDT